MIVPVHIVGYSNMMSSINGNTKSQTVYFQTPEQQNNVQKKKGNSKFLTMKDMPLLTVAALGSKPKTLSAFAKSFVRLPLTVASLAIPAAIAAKATTKIVDHRNKQGKDSGTILPMAGFLGAWYGLYKAGEIGAKKIINAIPDSSKKEIGKTFKNIEKTIDSTSLNKKVYEPIAQKVKGVLKAHPGVWKPAMIAATIGAVAICLSPSSKQKKEAQKLQAQQAQQEQLAKMIQQQKALEDAQQAQLSRMLQEQKMVENAEMQELNKIFNKTI